MPSVEPYLSSGMRIRYDSDRMTVTVPYHVKDIEDPGENNPVLRLAAAVNVTGVPPPGDRLLVQGREVFARGYDIASWSNADAELVVTYSENEGTFDGDGIEIEVGTVAELGETDFDAANQIVPWAERVPMYVLYEPGKQGAPVEGGSGVEKIGVRLPTFVGKPYRRYTKTLGEDPGLLSEQFTRFVTKTTWKGYPPETVLCMSIVGRNAGQGFRTTFDFAIDRETKWRQVFRVTDQDTGEYVNLTKEQVAGLNGIKNFLTQPTKEFSQLPI